MFESKYKKTYDIITPAPALLADTIARANAEAADARGRSGRRRLAVKASIAAAALLCLVTAVPVCAARIPACYRIVEYLSPALADRLVPIEKSSTSQGITMQMEAVYLEGNKAEIIVSLQDAPDSTQDLVHGEMDLFDSYGLSDYTNDSIIGGCYFLTYDAEADKAYFKVSVQAGQAYRADKLQFRVRSVLCGKYEDTKDVDLSGIVCSADTKRVTLSGSGGAMSAEELPASLKRLPGTAEDPRPGANVLDIRELEECAADDFTVTGAAYMDGVLRVQICMGDNRRADRHVELFLKASDGSERYPDHSVSWDEEEGDTRYTFYEFWYVEDIADMGAYSMYGIFHDSGALVEGDWRVTFRVEAEE